MKVANITLHAINNYGSVLQTLATERIFQDLGCEVETIDYVRETAQLDSVWKILKYGGPTFKIKIKQLILHFLPRNSKRAEKLEDFRKKYLHLTKKSYRSDKELENDCPVADIYCTGSDQTWNTVCQMWVPRAFFLHFAPDEKKKIAFSASFGVDKLPDADKSEVKKLLSRYDAISVRESSGVEIVKGLGLHAELVLDPTLAVDKDLWHSLATTRLVDDDYILAYQLNSNPVYVKYVNEFAQQKGIKVVHVRSSEDKSIHNCIFMGDCSPEEFLSLFKYSKYVITDSFHATVFSTIFHRQFANIFPPLFSSRLNDFLDMLDLQSRRVVNFNDFSVFDKAIDYQSVDANLKSYQKHTINFLRDSIK